MAELLTKERLAEVFQRIDQGYHMTLRNQIFEDVLKLRDHIRALEAERDRLRLPIRAQATVETAMKQAVDDFRQRAIEAVRAHVNKYDDHYKHCLTGCIPELLQSLPAISEQEENSEG